MAAGVTIKSENIEAFRKEINRYAKEKYPEMPAPVLSLDCRLNPASVNAEMPKALQRLEPFGGGNPQPLFGLFGMELREIVPVGNGGHLRLVCQKNGAFLNCMRFRVRQEEFPFHAGDKLDLAVTLDLREYRGELRLTVTARDIRLSGMEDDSALRSYRAYEKFRRGEPLLDEERAMLSPTRAELAALYRLLASFRGAPFGVQTTALSLKDQGFRLGKLLLCLDMLEERGLAKCSAQSDIMTVQLQKTEGKVDVFASPIYIELQGQVS